MRSPVLFVAFLLLLHCAESPELAEATPSVPAASLRPVPCEQAPAEARCYWATVPEDRASTLESTTATRTLDLWVVVVPARSGTSAEPVLFFPGGPGQATTDLIGFTQQFYGQALERRDAVYIGQRGTGRSHPLDCRGESIDEATQYFGRLFDPELVASCHREALSHSDPSLYNTPHYVEDIADVLDLLQYERVVLWGGSGGTRTALAFLRAHPERVVSAALLGVAPVDLTMPLPFASYVDRAWQRVVDECAAQPACREAYPELELKLDEIRQRLEAGPVTTTIRDAAGRSTTVEVGLGDFAYATRGMLYNSQTIARLPRVVTDAARTGDLSAFADALYQRSRAILGGALSLGVHLSSYCSEDVPWIDRASVEREVDGTLLGRYLVDQYSAACDSWPVDPVPLAWREPVASDVPVLLVSGYFDPSTPDVAAERALAHLPNGRHFVVRGAGHDAGFGCMVPLIDGFLKGGSFEELDEECVHRPLEFQAP